MDNTINGWRCRKCKSTHLEMYDIGKASAHNDIIVKIDWYENELGNRVYDIESMREEFEQKLKEVIDE